MQPPSIRTRPAPLRPLVVLLLAGGLVGATAPAGADLLKRVSDVRELSSGTVADGDTEDMLQRSPSGGFLGAYRVPEKRMLVVTMVTILPALPGPGLLQPQLLRGPGGNQSSYTWSVPMDAPTQLHFPTGLIFSPGELLRLLNPGSSDGAVNVVLTGYETRAR